MKAGNLAFRAIALATLVFVACVFGAGQNAMGPAPQQSEQSAARTIGGAPRSFGTKLIDDPVAFFTAVSAFLTSVLSGVGAFQLYFLRRTDESTRRSADAAKEAAQVAKSSLVAAQRAWVTIEIEIGGDGLTFDMLGMRVPVVFKLRNIGNTIALRVTPYAKIFFAEQHGAKIDDWRKFIAEAIAKPGYMSIYLLPNGITQIASEPESVTILLSTNPLDRDTSDNLTQEVIFFIGGCVTYTFPSDPDTVHHTGFFFHVARKDRKSIAPRQAHVPASEFILARDIGTNFFSIN